MYQILVIPVKNVRKSAKWLRMAASGKHSSTHPIQPAFQAVRTAGLHLPSNQPMPAKPKLGQNFLVDTEAIQRIAASIGDLTGRTVVEIGPGHGAITAALAARAAHVLAVELDHELALHLRVQFPPERVTVVEQDVLQLRFCG